MFGTIPIILTVVWISLVWMVRKENTNIFHDQIDRHRGPRREAKMKELPTNPAIKFRLSTVKTGEPMVKVFRDDEFIAKIYGDKEGTRLLLVSKYFDGVEYKTGRPLAVVIKLSGHSP